MAADFPTAARLTVPVVIAAPAAVITRPPT
jgi:hypothetical protein